MGRSALKFEPLLVFVHFRVRALKYVLEALVLTGDIIGHPAGHNNVSVAHVSGVCRPEALHQRLPPRIVRIRQDRRELVAADAVHGAVVEGVADQLTRPADVCVARRVTKGVVGVLEAVEVEHHNRKREIGIGCDPLVPLRLRLNEDALGLDAGQRVAAGKLRRLLQGEGLLLLPPEIYPESLLT